MLGSARPAPSRAQLLFVLWPIIDGHPHPDSADPWGETHAADCLTGYDDSELGPYLTVTATTDDVTCHLVYAGDASDALLSYAARVARDTEHPPFEGSPIEQARDAFEVAVEKATYEHTREACYDWCEPDPDTSRSIRRMPDSIRAAIEKRARTCATQEEAEYLDVHLCEALGISAPDAPPLRLAA